MIYGSVCSGIEAATVAWEPLGWRPAWFAEVDPFCCTVLAHHYPKVRNHGDFRSIGASAGPVDLLVGGTPCQDFSVAGLRAGLAGERGNLTLEFLRLADRLRPRWLVWENVPGVLSIDKGRAFGALLGGLGQLGYGFAYRVLDAQYFGVPQRRRRVFVIGHLGDWRRAVSVLFERHCLSGHPAPRREAGESAACQIAPGLTCSGRGTARAGDSRGQDCVIPVAFGGNNTSGPIDIASACNAHGGSGRMDFESETFVVGALQSCGTPNGHGTSGTNDQAVNAGHIVPVEVAFSSKDYGADATEDLAPTLRAMPHHLSHPNGGGNVAVTVALRGRDGGATAEIGDDVNGTLRASRGGGDKAHVLVGLGVRRLTPRECERLQGFEDDYTLVPYPTHTRTGRPRKRVKLAADGPRYKAIGNSMAIPVMRWLGRRIHQADKLCP